MNNIVIEDNLMKVIKHTTRLVYDADRPDDLLSQTDSDISVIFKMGDEEYPDGKIVRDDVHVTKYDYNYSTDSNGITTGCVVTITKGKNDKSLDHEKTKQVITYNEKGRPVNEQFYTREGVRYLVCEYVYNKDGILVKETKRGLQTTHISEYNNSGHILSLINITNKSKAKHIIYKVKFDNNGYLIEEWLDNIHRYIERDFDADGNMLSETQRNFNLDNTKLLSTKTIIYNTQANDSTLKYAKIIENGITVEKREYNLKGDLISVWVKEDENEVFHRISKTVDDEGIRTVNRKTCITMKNGKQEFEEIKETFDADNKLLSYAESNSKVTEYAYDDENRRVSAITKQLVNGEFIIVNEITYSYETDEETGNTTKTRIEKVLNENGDVITQTTHTETLTDNVKEFIKEERRYTTSSNVPVDTDDETENEEE